MLQEFIQKIQQALQNDTFIKMSLSGYKGKENTLKKLVVRQILLKNEPKLSVVFRFQTKDITKNYTLEDGIKIVQSYLEKETLFLEKQTEGWFNQAILFTTANDVFLKNVHTKSQVSIQKASQTQKVAATHDKIKQRAIQSDNKTYLQALTITDHEGKVFKKSQDKYKQINQFIALLKPSLQHLSTQNTLQVVDMGAGKGYLTFALYDFLRNNLKYKVDSIGVEFRKDLVDLCNQIAVTSNFETLHFVEGTIADFEDFDTIATKIVIALHACDTATDDAICKGIVHEAELIVVAPCCHKQIRRELEKTKQKNELSSLTNYGIFLERQAEMLTDTMRALILEQHGYQTKIVEFISDAHTPKNVLLIATKSPSAHRKTQAKAELDTLKTYFGIEQHYLEKCL